MADKKKNIVAVKIPPVTINAATMVTASSIKLAEEKEFYYPQDYSSKEIVASLTSELNTIFKPEEKRRLIEMIDKTYISEFEFGLSPKDGLKLKFKRVPKVFIKIFS